MPANVMHAITMLFLINLIILCYVCLCVRERGGGCGSPGDTSVNGASSSRGGGISIDLRLILILLLANFLSSAATLNYY